METALEATVLSWGGQLALGATTFWEVYPIFKYHLCIMLFRVFATYYLQSFSLDPKIEFSEFDASDRICPFFQKPEHIDMI
jgi:hypothetical protein